MRSRSILYAVLALIVAAAMAALGFWQLQRAGAKEALLGGIAQAMAAPVMNFSDVQAESPDLRFRAVSINGQFDPAHQVLLDNQLRDGQPGVRVYVPFGEEWYGYLMRRMAERPANLGFFLRSLASRG